MTLQLLRYVDLSSAADPDPSTQPALANGLPDPDAFGPRLTGKGGRVLVNAWLVDARGVAIDGSGANLSLVVATWSDFPPGPVPPAGPAQIPAGAGAWGRGNILASTAAGVWFTQAQLGNANSFAVAVTAIVAPTTGFLAVYADIQPGGRVP